MSYRLTNCVVLLAAVAGGEAAQPRVQARIKALMEQALTADKYLDQAGGREQRRDPSRWKALAEQVKEERHTLNSELLAWAKSRAAGGRKYAGVTQATPQELRWSRDKYPQRPGRRMKVAEQRVAVLAAMPGSVGELVERIEGISRETVYRRLRELVEAGVVVRAGCNDWRAA